MSVQSARTARSGRQLRVPTRNTLFSAMAAGLAMGPLQAATITVDTTADTIAPGECSLRAALTSAGADAVYGGCPAGDPGTDTIEFDGSVTGTIYIVSTLEVDSPVTITGPGRDVLTLDGQSDYRVMQVTEDATISGLTVTNGTASYGAGIYVTDGATLDLRDCTLSDNSANLGGAIEVFDYGNLVMDNCLVTGNDAYAGGGIRVTEGTATITNSTFSGNTAYQGGGLHLASYADSGKSGRGRGVYSNSLAIENSVISGNNASVGGGIGTGNSYGGKLQSGQRGGAAATLDVIATEITGNTAYDYGGGIGASYTTVGISGSSLVAGNDAFVGGGIFFTAESGQINLQAPDRGANKYSLNISGSEISGNSAYYGSALVAKYGDITVQGAQISGNTASGGGGQYRGDGPPIGTVGTFFSYLDIQDATIDNNDAPYQGTITSIYSGTSISGSTISGNTGGGVASLIGSLYIADSGVEDNDGTYIGGVFCLGTYICDISGSHITGNSTDSAAGGISGYGGGFARLAERAGLPVRGQGGAISVTNTTVSGNSGFYAGGILAYGLTLSLSTVAGNTQTATAPPADGLRGGNAAYAGGVVTDNLATIGNSIIADNTGSLGPDDLAVYAQAVNGGGGPTVTMNYSLVEDPDGFTASGTGNIIGSDPDLAALADNGGDTLTHDLNPGSPALDAGDPAFTPPPEFDQRGTGFPRVVEGRLDMGALEVGVPEVGLSISDADFGEILISATGGPTDVTITNVGTGNLELGTLGITDTRGVSPFSISADACSDTTLASTEDCIVSVAFNPPDRGSFTAVLDIPSNADSSPDGVDLTGIGVAPGIAVAPSPVDFGNVPVGSTSADLGLTVTNSGDADLEVAGINGLSAPFSISGGTCGAFPFTLGEGTDCIIDFQFVPAAAGPAAQTPNLVSDAFDGSGDFELTGNGTLPGLGIDPATLNFGTVLIGSGATGTVTLTNTGDAALDIAAIDPAAAPFALTGGDCATPPFTLTPAQACTLEYAFTPDIIGPATQPVVVTSDAPTSPDTFNLTGEGIEPLVVPTLNRWGLVLFGGLMALLGIFGLRRRQQAR